MRWSAGTAGTKGEKAHSWPLQKRYHLPVASHTLITTLHPRGFHAARRIFVRGFFGEERDERIREREETTTHELTRNFEETLEAVRKSDPRASEQSVFEVWVVQKLASYEALIMNLNERVSLIASHTKKR